MTAAIWISLSVGGINVLALIVALSRGVVSKGDCGSCSTSIYAKFKTEKNLIDGKFKSGNEEFSEIQGTLTTQGKELAAQGATIDAIDSNVGKILNHHLKA